MKTKLTNCMFYFSGIACAIIVFGGLVMKISILTKIVFTLYVILFLAGGTLLVGGMALHVATGDEWFDNNMAALGFAVCMACLILLAAGICGNLVGRIW
ncbi:MAG TPA: hypothetical protein ENH82_03840 [bacterium]|nr:hypothetical protein [bacterium]